MPGLIRTIGPTLNVSRVLVSNNKSFRGRLRANYQYKSQEMHAPTIFLVHLLNLINIFPLQPKIVIKLIPMRSGRDLRAREARQRREIQPVDHQPNSMYNV